MIKVLNLYSGIGGNRKLWDNVEVTAIEYDPDIAKIYQDFYQNDKVIVGDAHQYLLEHYKEFDFIWSSPPCPTHSQYRYNVGVRAKGFDAVYPDMTLYQEIILLKYYFKGLWVVENTVSYYKPLIEPKKISRHYIWSNFNIPDIKIKPTGIRDKNKISDLENTLGFDLSNYKIKNKRQVLRNCVNPELGKHIFDSANI
jgi:DNA (cytosine-5)-methyltransferase 1